LRVWALTDNVLSKFSTRDTVAEDTPTASAICLMVTMDNPFGQPARLRGNARRMACKRGAGNPEMHPACADPAQAARMTPD
ncbi:MAG: hypothetical protein MUQ36_01810, partial [Planktomarina temperata]|nr:hypothetical protein [Planktomarina temperata]